MRLFAIALLALGALADAAPAQAPGEGVHPWLRLRVTRLHNPPLEAVTSDLRRFFDEAADGEEAITAETLRRGRHQRLATTRAGLLGMVYALDLDGDGTIDRQELERLLGMPGGDRSSNFRQRLLRADADRDGRLSVVEVLAFLQQALAPGQQLLGADALEFARYIETDVVPLALDRDGDGRVTRDEFETAIREAFAAFDTDGDGRLSRTEMEAARALGAR